MPDSLPFSLPRSLSSAHAEAQTIIEGSSQVGAAQAAIRVKYRAFKPWCFSKDEPALAACDRIQMLLQDVKNKFQFIDFRGKYYEGSICGNLVAKTLSKAKELSDQLLDLGQRFRDARALARQKEVEGFPYADAGYRHYFREIERLEVEVEQLHAYACKLYTDVHNLMI